jgi:thiol-disulfide isomerase/thioredoxin
MNRQRAILFFSLFLISICGFSQLQHGQALNDFKLFEPKTETVFDLSKEPRHNLLVLFFLAHECPYSKIYIERLIKTAKNYSDQDIMFIAIRPSVSSNAEAEHESMKKYAQHFPLPFKYLIDSDKLVTQELHITKTPSVYVFKYVNNAYVMEYRGAIDDAPKKEDEITEPYLLKALNALLLNKAFKYRYTEAVGCAIK